MEVDIVWDMEKLNFDWVKNTLGQLNHRHLGIIPATGDRPNDARVATGSVAVALFGLLKQSVN
jgi:hypothetical protein